MFSRLHFYLNRLTERLWVRPLLMCLISVAGAFVAKLYEYTPMADATPTLSYDSVKVLLTTMAGSMLVIATFAVGSMVASYASAATKATPRTFPLVVSDDASQNALSIFMGAFIFSLIALLVLENDFYTDPGRTALLALVVIVFGVVVVTFVRWVDSIARLGRLGTIIDKTERVTEKALVRRRDEPRMRCAPVGDDAGAGVPITAGTIGYVQQVSVDALQRAAEEAGVRIRVLALPGAFVGPGRDLARVIGGSPDQPACDDEDTLADCVRAAFRVGSRRTFDDDPRFGLIVLAEIADRALSPGINDPGTAIDIIGSMVRLFAIWAEEPDAGCGEVKFDRVEVPELAAIDLLDDAFTPIARDGAAMLEVAVRVQKALASIAAIGRPDLREGAVRHARVALERAEEAMTHAADIRAVREASAG
tara:strand:+ start:20028 stop:21290 length:1263 start_codon:yes stop_codon:yes gene_type:complete